MKYLIALLVFVFSAEAFAAPFVTPSMRKRNGLTDEQYKLLWSQGKHPQIDPATARDWIFKSSRYDNTQDWIREAGKTDDFAKLAHKLGNENMDLSDTNKVLKAENTTLTAKNEHLTEEVAELAPLAEMSDKAIKAREKAAKKDAKNLEKFIKETYKAMEKSSDEMKELYQSVLDIIDPPKKQEEENAAE